MYALPQADDIGNNLLTERLNEAGYHKCKLTPVLWKHIWGSVTFTLVVDKFGIKCVQEKSMPIV